jgi:hypothetical protein
VLTPSYSANCCNQHRPFALPSVPI